MCAMKEQPAVPDDRSGLREGYAEVGDVRLHYVEAGDGPLIVLLHGFPEFWYGWRLQIAPLAAAGFRVVAPDMRGYNLSSKPTDVADYAVPKLVEDVRALAAGLLKSSGGETFTLVAHDWGGVVAWVFAALHPQMLDIMSMCQFLIMTSDLLSVVAKAGGNMDYDWMRYLVTRYEPSDGPQTQMVGFMRSLFGERMLTNAMLKSTAISDAGITKQTLYEVSRDQFTRATYDRAIEALESVNGEIESLIRAAWGR